MFFVDTISVFERISATFYIKTTAMFNGIEKIYWSDIQAQVRQVEPEFASKVDLIAPGKDHPLYILSFPYGSLIGDDVSQFIPCGDTEFYRLSSPEAPEDIQKNLGYGKDSAPLGMVLEKSIEFFVDLPKKQLTLPVRIIRPGEFSNFTRILSLQSNTLPYAPNGLLKASSGARTVFSLPYLSCNASFSRLEREIGTLTKFPASQYDHCQLFSEIVNSNNPLNNWQMKMLYFSESWINSLLHDKNWVDIKSYLFQLAWQSTEYKRNQYYFDISFSLMREKGNCRANPYLNDTARHILDIIIGAFPGLCPTIDETLLPLKTIQHVLSYSYGLKKYLPTIIAPQNYKFDDGFPVYYSLNYPTTRSFAPKTKNTNSTIDNLDELKKILERFVSQIIKEGTMWRGTILEDRLKRTKIHYIHNSIRQGLSITSPLETVSQDKRFMFTSPNCVKENTEPSIDANFFRGCVRVC